MKGHIKLYFQRTIAIYTGFLFIAPVLLLLASCGIVETGDDDPIQEYAQTPAPTPAHNEAAIPTPHVPDMISRDPIIITSHEAQEMMQLEGIIILDVRTQDEFDHGHIQYAILLPYNEITALAASALPDKSQTILIYCQSGRRSNIAAWALSDLGYTAVYDFGGIQSWHGPIMGQRQIIYNYFGVLPEESVTPFNFTTTQRISPEAEELIFTLEGYSNRAYMRNFERTQFWPFINHSIHTIIITGADGNILQEITGLATENPHVSALNMYGLIFDDFNFNGYMDIRLLKYPGGSMRDEPSYFWLWDSGAGLFIQNDYLIDISYGASINTIPEYRQIEAFTRGGPDYFGWWMYEFHDDRLVLIRNIVHEFVYHDDDDDTVKWRVTETNFITGEETTTYRVDVDFN